MNIDFISLTFATKNKIDLIMMGTKGRTGLKRFLIGSVA
ncbi:MAG: universal stress protein [Nitrososphaeraceae archaeon]